MYIYFLKSIITHAHQQVIFSYEVLLYTKEEEVEVGDIIVIRLHFQQFVSYIMATRLNGETA